MPPPSEVSTRTEREPSAEAANDIRLLCRKALRRVAIGRGGDGSASERGRCVLAMHTRPRPLPLLVRRDLSLSSYTTPQGRSGNKRLTQRRTVICRSKPCFSSRRTSVKTLASPLFSSSVSGHHFKRTWRHGIPHPNPPKAQICASFRGVHTREPLIEALARSSYSFKARRFEAQGSK